MKSDNQVGKLFIVGIGPGNPMHLTLAAREALTQSDVIVGYKKYIELVKELITDKQVIATGMGEEVKRAAESISLATAGKTVSLVSGGDPGIYGMAGLVLELLHSTTYRYLKDKVNLQIIPGVTAFCAAAALLGAPLMHDFAVISLSDRLTPWQEISRRLQMAAQGDFIIVLYNPKSTERQCQISKAREILLKYRSGSTPVGVVNSAYRDGQSITITDLEHMLDSDIDMSTTIVVGKSNTFRFGEWLITPRGYQAKYR